MYLSTNKVIHVIHGYVKNINLIYAYDDNTNRRKYLENIHIHCA